MPFLPFLPGIVLSQELIFTFSFKLQLQKLLSKTFCYDVAKTNLGAQVCHLATISAQRSYPVQEHGCLAVTNAVGLVFSCPEQLWQEEER